MFLWLPPPRKRGFDGRDDPQGSPGMVMAYFMAQLMPWATDQADRTLGKRRTVLMNAQGRTQDGPFMIDVFFWGVLPGAFAMPGNVELGGSR